MKKLRESNVPHGTLDVPENCVFHGFLCGKALIEDADGNLHFSELLFDMTKQPFTMRVNERLSRLS